MSKRDAISEPLTHLGPAGELKVRNRIRAEIALHDLRQRGLGSIADDLNTYATLDNGLQGLLEELLYTITQVGHPRWPDKHRDEIAEWNRRVQEATQYVIRALNAEHIRAPRASAKNDH